MDTDTEKGSCPAAREPARTSNSHCTVPARMAKALNIVFLFERAIEANDSVSRRAGFLLPKGAAGK